MAIFPTLTSWNASLGAVTLPWSSAKLKQKFLDLYESVEAKLKSNVTDAAGRLAWKGTTLRLNPATEDGQTQFAAALPAGAEVLLVFLPSFGGTPLEPDVQYTLAGGTLTLIGDAYAQIGDRPVVYYQTQPIGLPDPEAAPPTANLFTKVADVTAAGTPDNTFSYTPVADDGTITELRKVNGQIYEAVQLIPYIP